MGSTPSRSPRDPAKMSFEEAIEEVESLIEEVDEGRIGLEASLEAYKRGMALVTRCRQVLDQAEQKVRTLTTELDETSEPDGNDAATASDGSDHP
ncbi:MAG: exodeoxyribonuclease VII small subunit [Phycisphaerales bacterium]|nr:exodeoxyribonuclease VII small subunit [Phycisphaerales bacterium]